MNDKNPPIIEQEDMNQSLTIEMALNNISQYKGFFPKADVDYLLTKKEEIIPVNLTESSFPVNFDNRVK